MALRQLDVHCLSLVQNPKDLSQCVAYDTQDVKGVFGEQRPWFYGTRTFNDWMDLLPPKLTQLTHAFAFWAGFDPQDKKALADIWNTYTTIQVRRCATRGRRGACAPVTGVTTTELETSSRPAEAWRAQLARVRSHNWKWWRQSVNFMRTYL